MNTDDKKKKQKPYSEFEKQLLMQLVMTKMDIVENRKTDGTSQKKKTEAWEDIACHYNNSPNVSQRANAAQLKKM
ncbi:unnamed protein product [Arctia plantaginis]|uniref:Regulatory protein zeste n=1 Tax=Arctia plantaginis TaxID=874455 RepID=A0A8S0ZEQ6_ARCPL|nr:unnamed protein product [Arctia plantaginis]